MRDEGLAGFGWTRDSAASAALGVLFVPKPGCVETAAVLEEAT
jgi:hypothetical protein